jgi:flavin-dependent dehydrogenase
MLLDVARQAGAEVYSPMEARVEGMDDEAVTVVLQGAGVPSQMQQYGAVVIASGLNASGSQRLLPWREKPNGPFGVSFFARSDTLPRGVIHMACDDDGYVGLVRLEDDRVDIAAALNSGAEAADQGSSQDRIERILTRSRLTDWQYFDTTPLMTTPPLRRRRHAGNGRVIAIGDAAGYVEPFTGEGMTWGMASALAAADMIAEFADPWSGLGEPWSQKLDSLLRNKRLACRAVTTTLRSPIARRAIAATLAQWPAMAAPLLKHLSHL